MNYSFPDILTLGTFDSKEDYPTAFTTAPRTVFYYELEYFFMDGGTSVINGVPYKISKGSILLAKPGDIRYSQLPFTCRFVHFTLDDNNFTDSIKRIKSFSHVTERNKTEDFFSTISSLFHSGNTIDHMAASAELLLLLRSLTFEQSGNTNIISIAQKFIEDNYHLDICADSIAQECNVSVSYLHQMFKKKLNITPGDYLIRCRISAACNLLINTTLPLIDIAFRCGFNSQSYFSYCFKEHTGLSPKDYRKKYSGAM